jgi:hypothetical protein
MSHYIRYIFDYCDDDVTYHLIISFENEEDAIEFNNKYLQDDALKLITPSKNTNNEFIKKYVENTVLICQPRPKNITTKNDFDNVIKLIKSIVHYDNFHIRLHKSKIKSDFIVGLAQSIYSMDENQLMLFDIQIKKDNSSTLINNDTSVNNHRVYNSTIDDDDDDDDDYDSEDYNYNHDNYYKSPNKGCRRYDFKIVKNDEHDIMCKTYERITLEKINAMNYPDKYHVKINHVEIELYKNKIQILKSYCKTSIYNIASDKHEKWNNIFYKDPEHFTINDEIIEHFDSAMINTMKEEIIKINNEIPYENIKTMCRHHQKMNQVCYFTNKYIYTNYINYLKVLQKNIVIEELL